MTWAHLPIAGGIYDQHPALLDDFVLLDGINNKAKARRQAMEARKARRK